MKATVIIPIYNTSIFLRQCVDSVLKQKDADFEIILVDDGSTDESPLICDEYAKLYRSIKVIHKHNGGLSTARNSGISASTGEVIFFIDSDDYWIDEFAIKNITNLISEHNYDFVEFGTQKCDESATIFFKPDYTKRPSYQECCQWSGNKEKLYNKLLSSGALIGSACNKAVKRELFLKYNLQFREGIKSEDVDWVARLLIFTSSVGLYNKTVLIYRQRSGSITHSYTAKSLKHVLNNFYYIESLGEKKIINNYLSIAFTNLLILISSINKSNIDILLPDIDHFLPYLRFGQTKRPRMVLLSYKLFGLKITLLLMKIAFYIKRSSIISTN